MPCPGPSDQKALRARVDLSAPDPGDDRLPDLSDISLAERQPRPPALSASTAPGRHHRRPPRRQLSDRLPYLLRAEIDRLLPSHFTAPTGSHLPIDYAAENGPALEIRVQELFGLDRHPAIAGGKIPLLLILLSPAHRPIQTTRDLPGFWRGSWKDVAKDLKGRYPRHPWPDDPLTAPPTARAKPRGT